MERKRQRNVSRVGLALLMSECTLLAACAVGPKYSRPAVQAPATYKEASSPQVAGKVVWQVAQPQDASDRGKWWKIFGDPDLDKLEEKAETANQNIQAAAANFMAARAIVRQARSQYFPKVSIAPSITNQRPSSAEFGGLQTGSGSTATVKSFTDYSLPLDASWEPDLWGRLRRSVQANTFAAQASAADLANVRLSEEAELAADYYSLRGQDALKRLLDSTVAAYEDNVTMTRSLYAAGVDSDEALAQAEAQWKAAQAQDTNVGVLRAQYEHAIAVLIGEPASAFSLPPQPLQAMPPRIPAGIPGDLLQRRPDIAAAERGVAQANAQIGFAKAAYFPTVVLSAVGGFGNSSAADWFIWPSRFWSVGSTITETIFDAGLRHATEEQYRAIYEQNTATYRETVLTAFQEVEDNLVALRILSQDIEEQDAAVEAATRSLHEATVRYRAGLDPYLNVVTAQMTLLSDQQIAVNFRVQQMVAAVQLVKALGGGWTPARFRLLLQSLTPPRKRRTKGGRE